MSDNHPDFDAAPAELRWTKSLADLGVFLRKEVWAAKGEWVWRMLPHGACVAMRIIAEGEDAFRRELRVSRRGPLANPEAISAWSKECRVFREHLGCASGWRTVTLGGRLLPNESTQSGDPTEWTTRESAPFTDGTRATLTCTRCGKVAEPGSDKYKEVLCNQCAVELGRAEAQAKGH